MSRKPLIAITVDAKPDPADARSGGSLTLNWNYADSIARAGGVPLLIPPMADMEAVARLVDGWLIPGGADIDARHFGEENHPKVDLMPPGRFEGERSLYQALPAEAPILGICYGCQFLNVMRGGSLIQHLPDVVPTTHTGGTMQEYRISPDTRLASVLGTTMVEGKSYHHQAVARVGSGLAIAAHHADGTIEGLEANDHPWLLGVQWHPERTPGDTATQNLFLNFVRAAADYAETKR